MSNSDLRSPSEPPLPEAWLQTAYQARFPFSAPRARRRWVAVGPALDRETWRMPPLEELPKPVWSTARRAGMYTLRGYLIVAVVLLVVKVVQLALGSQ